MAKLQCAQLEQLRCWLCESIKSFPVIKRYILFQHEIQTSGQTSAVSVWCSHL